MDLDVGDGATVCGNVKFLGMVLDQSLKFGDQVAQVCSRLNKAFFALSRLKLSLTLSGVLSAYYALAYSIMSYCVIGWGRATEWKRVFIIQKRMIRLIFNLSPRESCRNTFVLSGLLTFPCIYIYKAVVFVKKNPHQFSVPNHNYNTRNTDMLSLVPHSTSLFEKSPQYSFAKMFNALPGDIRGIADVRRFKLAVKEFLIRGAYYSYQEYLTQN